MATIHADTRLSPLFDDSEGSKDDNEEQDRPTIYNETRNDYPSRPHSCALEGPLGSPATPQQRAFDATRSVSRASSRHKYPVADTESISKAPGHISPSLDHISGGLESDDETPVDTRESSTVYRRTQVGSPISPSDPPPTLDGFQAYPEIPQPTSLGAISPLQARAPLGWTEYVYASDNEEPVKQLEEDSEAHQGDTDNSFPRNPSGVYSPIRAVSPQLASADTDPDDEEPIDPFSSPCSLRGRRRGLFRNPSPDVSLPSGSFSRHSHHYLNDSGKEVAGDMRQGAGVYAEVSDTIAFHPPSSALNSPPVLTPTPQSKGRRGFQRGPLTSALHAPQMQPLTRFSASLGEHVSDDGPKLGDQAEHVKVVHRDGLNESFSRGLGPSRHDSPPLTAAPSPLAFGADVSDDEKQKDVVSSVKIVQGLHESPQNTPPVADVRSTPSPDCGSDWSNYANEAPVDVRQSPPFGPGAGIHLPVSKSRSPTLDRSLTSWNTSQPTSSRKVDYANQLGSDQEDSVNRVQSVRIHEQLVRPSPSPSPLEPPLRLPFSTPCAHLVEDSSDRQEYPGTASTTSQPQSLLQALGNARGRGGSVTDNERHRSPSSCLSHTKDRSSKDGVLSNGSPTPVPAALEALEGEVDGTSLNYLFPGAYPSDNEPAVPTQQNSSDSLDDENPVDVGSTIPSQGSPPSRHPASFSALPEDVASASLHPSPRGSDSASDDEEPVATESIFVKEDSESGKISPVFPGHLIILFT